MSVVFFDVDKTLVDRKNRLPDSTVLAIRRLRERGHLAYINTGYSLCEIPDAVKEIGFDGIVAACGTSIRSGNEVLLEKTIPVSLLKEILSAAEEHGFILWLEGPEFVYVSEVDAEGLMGQVVKYISQGKDIIRSWKENLPIVNKFTFMEQSPEQVKPYLERIENHVDIISHSGQIFEAVPAGFNKAEGMKFLLRELNLEGEVTYAFGDSSNDIPMLKQADHGIAMGGANPSAQAESEFVTAPVGEGGISLALKHYGLIP